MRATLPLPVEAISAHGDTPRAVEPARAVRSAIEGAGLTVTALGR